MHIIQLMAYNAYIKLFIAQYKEFSAYNAMHEMRCIECNAKKTMNIIQCKQDNEWNSIH